MNVDSTINAVIEDLRSVAQTSPNERLPKEEQIRCSVYHVLHKEFDVVCAERGYASIDEGSRIECDLFARSTLRGDVWIEFKRCWAGKGWINKPPEQLACWEADVQKLRRLPISCDRYFILFGLFDCDPLPDTLHNGVVTNIKRFYPPHLILQTSQPFSWRPDDGLTCIAAWVWHWPTSIAIE